MTADEIGPRITIGDDGNLDEFMDAYCEEHNPDDLGTTITTPLGVSS